MGAWGYGIYDNDMALDLKGDFDDYLEEGYHITDIFNALKDSWYTKYNCSLLVLADLQLKHLNKIDCDIYHKVMIAIEEELENVSEWREPYARIRKLLEFREKISKYILEEC